MDSRQRRVVKNEVLFREVNERIKEVSEGLGANGPLDFLCECGRQDCTKPVSLTLEEYERVRAEPTHFAVLPGHQDVDVEREVSRTDRFVVVEKRRPAGAVAVERDPRA